MAAREQGHPSMSIGRLAALTGVSSRTIRYYEELGILPPPPRSPGGTRKYPGVYRYYVEGALALKEMGFALDEIRLLGAAALGMPLSSRQRDRATASILAKERGFEAKIGILRQLRAVLDAQRAGGSGSAGASAGAGSAGASAGAGAPAPLPVEALVALFKGALRDAAGLGDPEPAERRADPEPADPAGVVEPRNRP